MWSWNRWWTSADRVGLSPSVMDFHEWWWTLQSVMGLAIGDGLSWSVMDFRNRWWTFMIGDRLCNRWWTLQSVMYIHYWWWLSRSVMGCAIGDAYSQSVVAIPIGDELCNRWCIFTSGDTLCNMRCIFTLDDFPRLDLQSMRVCVPIRPTVWFFFYNLWNVCILISLIIDRTQWSYNIFLFCLRIVILIT